MSTKGHFIYENGIEGFTDCSNPRSIFGKHIGDDAWLILDKSILKSVNLKDEHLIIETRNTDKLPAKFQIWGGAIVDFEIYFDFEEGIIIHLIGGNHVTEKIVKNDYEDLIIR